MIGLFVKNNIRSKKLRSMIVILSFAISVALILSVFNMSQQVTNNFIGNAGNYDVIVGAKGSSTQLVLNSIFFYDTAEETIPYEVYEDITTNAAYTEYVKRAVPLAVADNVEGYKMVGTTEAYFAEGFELSEGRFFLDTAEGEAVLGATVADSLGLEVGDTFKSEHGEHDEEDAEEGEVHEHDLVYTVVGILKKTKTPADVICFTELANIWHAHEEHAEGEVEHAHEEGEEEHAHEEGDLTAILVLCNNSVYSQTFADAVAENNVVSSEVIYVVMRNMLSLFDSVLSVIKIIVAIVIVMSLVMMFLSMFTAVGEMKRDLAVLRALGSNRRSIFGTVVLEALVLSVIGVLAGYIISRIVVLTVGLILGSAIGANVVMFTLYGTELAVLLIAPVLGVLAAIIPAIMVYRLEPTEYLR